MREPRTFLTSPKSLQVAEPSSGNAVVAKQLSGHVLLDYGIFMDFADVLRGLASFFLQAKFCRQMEHSRRLVECFKRVAELNSLHFVNGLKMGKMSGGASNRVHSGPTLPHCPNGLSGPRRHSASIFCYLLTYLKGLMARIPPELEHCPF